MKSTDCGCLCSYGREIAGCNEISKIKSDSFQVDMEPFSHLTNKDNMPRSLSKKGEEKKMMISDPSVDNDRDAIFPFKGIMSETSVPVSIGTIEPQSHHQISIITSSTTTAITGTPRTKNKLIGKRSTSFKQSSIINPTRIVFFFATLSSMGTILLIYFTLSMAKYNGDKNLD